ncbi:DUF636 domain protein [Aspergillus sclerotioniger CBS 115572]|uniref:DUF636 domain protein n=1 Tax=Aspergillus sclerotioniger CBS 115572 TaxID=1450535 RepID=A0A317VNT0_9EURO|nr:DUF636 domain protein [Aspergillus sclerotioniger CBS 115572]PWY76024.1 DUF636 domain protein [Aspergillus sclerotioniger CBS 115572]
MAIGSCFCNNIRIEYTGQLLISGLCHCLDCRKLTGAPYSYNYIVKTSGLKVSGTVKEVAKTSSSDRNYFCPECGTPVFSRKEGANEDSDGVTIVRAGVFNDAILNERKPQVEIFADMRLEWVRPVEGAEQFGGMLDV